MEIGSTFLAPRALDLYMHSWQGIGHVTGSGAVLQTGRLADFRGIVARKLHERMELFLEISIDDRERFVLVREIDPQQKRHCSWWSCALRNGLCREEEKMREKIERDIRVYRRAKLCLA